MKRNIYSNLSKDAERYLFISYYVYQHITPKMGGIFKTYNLLKDIRGELSYTIFRQLVKGTLYNEN